MIRLCFEKDADGKPKNYSVTELRARNENVISTRVLRSWKKEGEKGKTRLVSG